MVDAGEIADRALRRRACAATPPACRSPTSTFDRVITCEVLEHIQDDVGGDRRAGAACSSRAARSPATVPTWCPEKINWMLQRRVPRAQVASAATCASTRATELKAKLRAAGLDVTGSHHAHALHSPYWWLKCAVGADDDDHRAGQRATSGSSSGTSSSSRARRGSPSGCCRPVLGKSHRRLRPQADSRVDARQPASTAMPRVCLTLDGRACSRRRGASHDRRVDRLAAAADRDDPVVPRRALRPVEPRRDGDGARRRRPPRRGRAGLRVAGRHRSAPTAAGGTTTCPTASVEEAKLDTNVCAYIATGVWHHWLCTGDRGFVDHLWPTVERALDWVLSMRRADGTVAVGVAADDDRRGTTPCSPARRASPHALRCGAQPRPPSSASRGPTGSPPPTCCAERRSPTDPDAFEPKDRWAMDWYYPVLTGALTGERGQGPPGRGLGHVRHGGQGHPLRQRRAVGHRVGDRRVRARPRRDRRPAPRPPTCCAGHAPTAAPTARTGPASSTPDRDRASRSSELSAYTGAAVILAADAIDRRVRCQRCVRAALRTRRPLATSRLADGPAATAQLVGQHVGREPTDQQRLRRLERVGLLDDRHVGLSSSVDVSRSIIADASDLRELAACLALREPILGSAERKSS